MKKIYSLFLLFAVLVANQANSQFNFEAANAVVTTSTYTDLAATGTVINTKFLGGTLTYDEDTSAVQNIGFTFNYNGTSFTQFTLSTNGFIKLGNTAATNSFDVSLAAYTDANIIAPFNMDLEGATSPEYRVTTSGAAGSRVCTIQFKDLRDYPPSPFTPGTNQYSSINFQIKLYETSNNVEFVYGTFTPSATASIFTGATGGIRGASATNAVNVTKASATAWASATFLNGPYTGNRLNHRNGVLPTPGHTFRFVSVPPAANDASIEGSYLLGTNGRGLPNSVRALIKNKGVNTLTNLVVTLNVTGANSFTTSITIPSIASGVSGFVTFNTYTSNTIGSNTVTISIPADDNNTNNSQVSAQEITANQVSYAVGTTATGAVNVGATPAEVAVKYVVPYANSLSKVDVFFTTAGQTFDVIIYNNVAGVPGTAIGTMAGQTSVAGLNSLTFPVPVSINDTFYVALKSNGASLAPNYQVESPLRTNTFFLKSTAVSAWFDLAGNSANIFRIMMGFTTTNALPVKLTTFTGKISGDDAILNWSTSTEVNNRGFEIQRSADGNDFTTIGFVAGAGNSTNNNNYQFVDKRIALGNHFYRLKQVDNDGRVEYSAIVKLNKTAKSNFEVIVINPSKDKVFMQVNSETSEKVSINLYNMNGQLIATKNTEISAGSNSLSIGQNLSKGSYIVTINKNGDATSYKVLVD